MRGFVTSEKLGGNWTRLVRTVRRIIGSVRVLLESEAEMTQFLDDEKWAVKITGLLNKAERSDNDEEIDALERKAEQLIQKYGVDRARLDALRRAGQMAGTPEKIITTQRRFYGKYAGPLIVMANDVVHGLGNVRCMSRGGEVIPKEGRPFWFVGYESDVHQAELLVQSLELQCISAMGRWWNRDMRGMSSILGASKTYQARRQFIWGFGSGVRERLISYRTSAIQ